MKSRKIYVWVAVLCIAMTIGLAFSTAASADYQTEEAAVTEVTAAQLSDSEVRLIVREEFGMHLEHMGVILAALGILTTVFVVILPIGQMLVNRNSFKELKEDVKERTEKLDVAINATNALKQELHELKNNSQAQIKALEEGLKERTKELDDAIEKSVRLEEKLENTEAKFTEQVEEFSRFANVTVDEMNNLKKAVLQSMQILYTTLASETNDTQKAKDFSSKADELACIESEFSSKHNKGEIT
ncbi:MAG: hypothetical protein FWE40_04725 [Oscillospiraceae bacterium]|nr:hypothetical protein [Oscillospiraceae bacterium]